MCAIAIAVMAIPSAASADEPGRGSADGASDQKAAGGPKLAGTRASASTDANVVSTEEGEEGVKTYKFGAVEVEGRLRSPQIIYFLRRVRAQFATEGLGHRSFLRELSDTRRHPALK
jgi:hypothetical protein